MRPALFAVLLLPALALAQPAPSPCPASAAPLSEGAITQGTLVARIRAHQTEAGCVPGSVLPFSLQHTEVHAEVTGFLASVDVTQVFGNPYAQPLEATYAFPLPESAAVNAMDITIGERVIRAEIQPRDQARATYERAKSEGKTAALLDQERPNLFTQSVANIVPGETIRVHLHYVERLHYEAGGYQFNFPMTVGPRFIAGSPLPIRQGDGTSPDTTQVPDASRITPPILPPDTRSGHDIALTVRIDAGLPLQGIASSSHQVTIVPDGAGRATVQLTPNDNIPNRTFTLDYRVADALIHPAVLVHHAPGAAEGYFMLLLQPQLSPKDSEVVPRELYLVLDTSGSQAGLPIEKSKAIAAEVLRHLMPEDTFQVLDFDTRVKKFAPAAVPATKENVERALPYVQSFWGGGGTDIAAATQEALAPPNDPARLRMVMFLTDGYIGDDDGVLRTVQQHLGAESRVFSVGVGSEVNRSLIAQMARVGHGSATFVNLNRPEADVAREFESRIRGPVLTSISIDSNGLPSSELYPRQVNDLFEGQPLFVVGRYTGSGEGVLHIRGQVRGVEREFTVPVRLPAVAPENGALESLWAREKISALTEDGYRGETPALVSEITQTALEHHLMSKYTSFVAVDSQPRVAPGGPSAHEAVPSALPQGVSYAGTFGSELSREDLPPGDPILSVRAPANARRVTAYFPFGLTLPLRFDRMTQAWRGRFLVPLGVADGSYSVTLSVETFDGQVRRSEVRYRLDSKGTDFGVTLSRHTVSPGDTVELDVDAIEPSREVSVYSELFGPDQLLLHKDEDVRFGRTLRIPDDAPAGDFDLVIVLHDAAGNRFERHETLHVVGKAEE